MAKSKRSSSQPSRQQRRLRRQQSLPLDAMARQLANGGGLPVTVPANMRAQAARIWAEVTGGEGVAVIDGKEVALS